MPLEWKMKSLRRLSRITFLGTALLLGLLVLTGYRQNNLMGDYSTIVKESERTIFLYATVREQTTEGLLSRTPSPLLAAAKEFEKLHGRYTSMLDNHLIPSQYKLTFLQNLDLEQVVINLRNLAEKPDNNDLILTILNQLRQINKQFLQFDRIVVGEMRNRVMQYQKQALILMGLIIALTCFTLIILYQKSVKPLLDLASQAEHSLSDGEFITLAMEKNSSVEVKALIASFNQLLHSPRENNSADLTHDRREAEFSAIVNEVTNGLNGIINYSQLLADYFEKEQLNDEQKQILYKIIENGEKSAIILQKGLHGGNV